ncbi:MAG: T9SS type A sorting domain-containing protein [Cyclobacteriaceae bacterium]|nr:T9SS type A sorting domain-containing protein [Cyclobacteriaceae bacterium]UYN86001.1 MAG: T9SS type A sorting domain-containing protein [Cyclobacteriaceae bacterium]
MKKVLTLFAVLVVTGAVFARAIDEPSKESAIVFVKNGSVVKVVYSSDKESVARVTITDLKGKEVFSEIVRSKKGFSRPYNLSQLSHGNYVVRVSDGRNTKAEVVSLQPDRKVVYKLTALDADRYALHIPALDATEVIINIYDEQLGRIHTEKQNISNDFGRVYSVKNAAGKVTFEVLPK